MNIKTDKKPYDMNAPQAKPLIDKIVHGTFIKEGTMVAFPMCFPGASTAIPADESHITALDVDSSGIIYGGTSGRLTHLFVAMFHGVTGAVFDMGAVQGADRCMAMCCGLEKFVACVNGPTGGRVIIRGFEPLPFSLIQEWTFSRIPFHDLGTVVPGEQIVHAVAEQTRRRVIGITQRHLFVVDIESEEVKTVAEIHGTGRLTIGLRGDILGFDNEGTLWRYDADNETLERKAVDLPDTVAPNPAAVRWAQDPRQTILYATDETGQLFSFTEEHAFQGPVGRTPLAPVGPMAVTLDGRLFGTCGREISKLFCWCPGQGKVRDLGVAVSVIERRRYGYVFGAAVVGRDGQIIFGEDDDLGHLWLYFPRIQPNTSAQ